ncbi:MAG: hypothetical protein H7315_04670 [Herminiimonas sp.]|nr:hypothetical protein [Herminiimonas sp.]
MSIPDMSGDELEGFVVLPWPAGIGVDRAFAAGGKVKLSATNAVPSQRKPRALGF